MIPRSQKAVEEFDQGDLFILSEGIRRFEEGRFDSSSHSASSGGTALAFLRRWIWVSMRRFRPPGGAARSFCGRSGSLMISTFYRPRPTATAARLVPYPPTATDVDQGAGGGYCWMMLLAAGRRPLPHPGGCVPHRVARFH